MSKVTQIKRMAYPFTKAKISVTGKIVDKYTHYYKNESVNKNTILYESRDGQSLTDSPFAIFKYLLKRDTEKKYTHIWTIRKSEEMTFFISKYKDYDNVIFVERNSDDYLKYLASVEFLINNATFQSFVTIKDDQKYINTWHGTPLKTMGFDIPGNPSVVRNVVRNFFMADYIISPNDHTTKMFLDSYRLRNNYQGTILEGGYPRIDATYNKNHDSLLQTLLERNLSLDMNKKVMLYTPTWKGGNLTYSENELHQIVSETNKLRMKFGDTYNVLIKVHPFLYEKAKEESKLVPYLIPDGVDTNEMLSWTDLLITDYSSIFFDYLVTNKPIVFYCWDDDLYSNDRGKYFDYDELPGPVAFTIDELISVIDELPKRTEENRWNYERFQRLFIPYDDGKVTERYVEHIFYGKPLSEKIKEIKNSNEKISLLIYPGGLRKNGITSSILNLLSNIDYDKYAVTCILDTSKFRDQIESIKSFPQEVSVLFRFGYPVYTLDEGYKDLYYHIKGVKKGKENNFPMHVYQREARRLFGKHHFDNSIDFSGYSLFWTKIILGSNSDQKICYLHSDMLADMEREVDGKKIHKMNVRGIISVYDFYDKLVSVSSVISDINKENLKSFASEDKFVFAENLLNIDSIYHPVIVEKETKDIHTEKLFRKAKLKEQSENLVVYNTRPDSKYVTQTEMRITNSDSLMVFGVFKFNDENYVKISQNDCYIGWIKEDVIHIEEDSIQSENDVDYFGKLNTNSTSSLYNNPIGLTDSKVVCGLKSYRNSYVKVKKETHTLSGSSYLVVDKKEPIGWIAKRDLTLSNRLNTKSTGIKKFLVTTARKGLSLTNKSAVKELSFYSHPQCIFDAYVRLSNDIVVYDEMNANSQSKKSIPKDSIIYLTVSYKLGNEEWIEIKDEEGNFLYALKETMNYSTLVGRFIIKNETLKFSAKTTKSEMYIYASIEDVLAGRGLLSKVPTDLNVLQQIKTNKHKTYSLVTIKNKKVWVNQENLTYDLTKGILNNKEEYFDYPETKEPTFVTVGRLSQEKNQALLIDAFKLYRDTHETGHLYIIGDGPERENLKRKINELELTNFVTLTGQFDQPYSFMSHCDVFVLTSDYEGQSLVLLEALTLNMKVISTDIPACRKVLDDGKYGMLTKSNDATGVANAMEAILKKKKSFKTFKPVQYNQRAMEHFERIISK